MTAPITVNIGQFSDSAVIHAIRHLGLDVDAGLILTTEKVLSSPGQFAALRDGDIDIAVTSPDNVLLYSTTAEQPLGEALDVRMLRAIDRGLGLTLFARPEITEFADLRGRDIGVDVVRSGFALLLFRMLASGGVERDEVTFVELGATPKRLLALQDGMAMATILNAESRIKAKEGGMREWRTSADISTSYLGTVLAVRGDFDPDLAELITSMWTTATTWLLNAPTTAVMAVLEAANSALGAEGYVSLLRDRRFGLLEDPKISVEDLQELARIRRESGAYTPNSESIAALASA